MAMAGDKAVAAALLMVVARDKAAAGDKTVLGNAMEAAKDAAKHSLDVKDRAAGTAGEVARAINEDGVALTLAKGVLSMVLKAAAGPVPEAIEKLKAAKEAANAKIAFANALRAYLPQLR